MEDDIHIAHYETKLLSSSLNENLGEDEERLKFYTGLDSLKAVFELVKPCGVIDKGSTIFSCVDEASSIESYRSDTGLEQPYQISKNGSI